MTKRDVTARGFSKQPWEADGSIVIERYEYVGPQGGTGVQWLVHRVKDGELGMVRACKSLSEALEVTGATS